MWPIEKIEWRIQDDHFKPQGLWVSDEDDYGWKQWCINEHFRYPDGFQYAYEIHLAENHNVLILKTKQDVLDFSRAHYSPELHKFGLEWAMVRRWWDGVIVTPYQSELRWNLVYETDHSTLWYTIWDCAGGCIWNPEAIRSFDTCQMSS